MPQTVTVYVSNLPPLSIIMWYGNKNTIPTGWALCDGTNGTPNLLDRFIVGAGNSYQLGATGGLTTVPLSIAEMPAHTHTTPISSGWQVPHQGSDHTVISPDDNNPMASSSVGGGQAHENRPPYFGLFYIMKTP